MLGCALIQLRCWEKTEHGRTEDENVPAPCRRLRITVAEYHASERRKTCFDGSHRSHNRRDLCPQSSHQRTTAADRTTPERFEYCGRAGGRCCAGGNSTGEAGGGGNSTGPAAGAGGAR